MELNAQLIKCQERLKKNKLYQVTADVPIVSWKEEHADSEPEIVELEFCVPKEGKAYISYEYRNKDFRKSKTADILCILVDDAKASVCTHIFDCKRTMTGYDETKSVDDLREGVVKRIKDFMIQIQDSIIHKDSLTGHFVKYCEYDEIVYAGIITREFDQEKLKRLEEKMQDTVRSSKHLGIAGKKYDIAAAGIRKDIEIVNNFRHKKIAVLNMDLDLQVHILNHSAQKQGYYAKIHIGGSGWQQNPQ